jgi:hypothetical protein
MATRGRSTRAIRPIGRVGLLTICVCSAINGLSALPPKSAWGGRFVPAETPR